MAEEISRRDAWLTVALAVARDGLPVPEGLSSYEGVGSIHIDAPTPAAGGDWGRHLGLTMDETIVSTDGARRIYRWNGRYDGWSRHVRATEPVTTQPEPASPLAAEVVAAILTPDSLPDVVAAQLTADAASPLSDRPMVGTSEAGQ